MKILAGIAIGIAASVAMNDVSAQRMLDRRVALSQQEPLGR